MANTFKVETANALTTTGSTVVAMTATSTAVILGCVVANTTTITGTATIEIFDDSRSTVVALVKNAEVPVGGSLELLSGGKVVLDNSDQIRISAGSSTYDIDATVSYLNQT